VSGTGSQPVTLRVVSSGAITATTSSKIASGDLAALRIGSGPRAPFRIDAAELEHFISTERIRAMTTFDAEALLRDARGRHKAAKERANRIRSRHGMQTATDKSGELFYSDGRGALGWLYEDGEDPDLVVRDSRFIKQMFGIWKRRPKIARGRKRSSRPSSSGWIARATTSSPKAIRRWERLPTSAGPAED